MNQHARRTREGLFYGLAAYGWWGLVPLYFKPLEDTPPLEVLAHRIVWSTIFLAGLLHLGKRWGEFKRCLTSWPILRVLCASTVLIALNWYFYIEGVAQRQIVQSSLGYFMTPLVSVGLGMVFFGERLRRLQVCALVVAMAGVVYLTIANQQLPGIALILASSFGLYGLLRKTAPVDGLVGLSVETLLLLPAAVAILAWFALGESASFGQHDWLLDVLLLLSGVVTAVPLMCFAQAARRLPLATLGFMQYLAPSLQFLLAVIAFREPFDLHKGLSFACIWLALALFSVDMMRQAKASREVVAVFD